MAMEEIKRAAQNSCCCQSPKRLRCVVSGGRFRTATHSPATAKTAQTAGDTVHPSVHSQRPLLHCASTVHGVRWRRSRGVTTRPDARSCCSCSPIFASYPSKIWYKGSCNRCSRSSLYSFDSSHSRDSSASSTSAVRYLWRNVVTDVTSPGRFRDHPGSGGRR